MSQYPRSDACGRFDSINIHLQYLSIIFSTTKLTKQFCDWYCLVSWAVYVKLFARWHYRVRHVQQMTARKTLSPSASQPIEEIGLVPCWWPWQIPLKWKMMAFEGKWQVREYYRYSRIENCISFGTTSEDDGFNYILIHMSILSKFKKLLIQVFGKGTGKL